MPIIKCEVPPETLRAAEEQVSVARRALSKRRPALTNAIYKTKFVPTTQVSTMAMTAGGVLFWNPNFVMSLTDNLFIQSVINHELWHRLRRHFARGEALQKLDSTVTHTELNMAGDCEINDDMLAAGDSFGPEYDEACCLPKHIGAPDGQTMEEYVYAAREHAAQQEQDDEEADGNDGAGGRDEVDEGRGDADGADGGRGEGGADAGDDGADGRAAGASRGAAGRGVGAGSCGSAAGSAPTELEAEMDKAYGQSPESQQNMIEQVAAAIVKEAQAGRGDYPADIVRWAEATIKPAKVKWHQLLAKIIRGRLAHRAGGGGVSYERPARRMAGLGYGNGRPVLPANRSVTPEVQAWVDTSGSVGSEELSAALAEIEMIMRTLPGRVTVGSCDAKVHALKKVARFSEVLPLLKGGGGTNFIPLFKAAMAVKDKPDVIVVLTDGMAVIPDEPPNDVDVIWVLIGRYKVSTMPWGRCVVVDEEE